MFGQADLFGLGQQEKNYLPIKVVDSDGKPVRDAQITFPADKFAATKTGWSGEATGVIYAPAGKSVFFKVSKPGYETLETTGTVKAGRFGPPQKVILEGPTSWLSVRVHDGGEPVPYAQVAVDAIDFDYVGGRFKKATDHNGYAQLKIRAEPGSDIRVSAEKEGYFWGSTTQRSTANPGEVVHDIALRRRPDILTQVGTGTVLVLLIAGVAVYLGFIKK